ncbi:tetratricopeptide repeat protein [bacterium]|nr:tetratricopeptide repeat protein [bacterium]
MVRPTRSSILLSMPLIALALAACSVRHTTFLSEADLAAAGADSLSLEAFLALDPAEQAARAGRARAAVRPLEAVEAGQRALDRRLTSPTLHLPQTMAHAVLPRVGDVLEHLDAALGLDPTRADLWLARARLLDLVGDRRRARDSLAQAWWVTGRVSSGARDRSTLRRDVAVAAAWLDREEGRWDDGLDWLDRARADVDPERDGEVGLLRGLLLAGRGDLEAAMALSYGLPPTRVPVMDALGTWGRLGLARRTSDMHKRWLQAEVWMRRGRRDLAWRVLGEIPYRRRLTVLPHRLYQDLGLYAELSGRPRRANLYYALAHIRRDFRQISMPVPLVCEPVVAGRPHRDLNFYVLETGAYQGGSLVAYAMSTAMRAMAAPESPRSETSYLLSSEALDACLRRDVRADAALAMRGRLRFSRGYYVLAEMDLADARERLARRGIVDPWTSYLLGLIAMGRDRPDEACTLLDESLAGDPDRADAWGALGVARLQLGDRQGAREALDRAIALDPHMVAAYFNRGLLRSQEGDLDGGLADFETAARLAPDQTRIARVIQLGRLARRQGKAFMPGLDAAGHWSPAAVEVQAHERGAFAPAPARRDDAWRDRLARLLDEVLAESGAKARAAGLDTATVARLEREHRAAPTPQRRKLLAHAYVWLDRLEAARDLLTADWGGDLDDQEVVLLLWLDQRAGERSRLGDLARRMGGALDLELAGHDWVAVAAQAVGDAGHATLAPGQPLRQLDASARETPNRLGPDTLHLWRWIGHLLRNGAGLFVEELLTEPRMEMLRIPDGGTNAVPAAGKSGGGLGG